MDRCKYCNRHFTYSTLRKYGGLCGMCYKRTHNASDDLTGAVVTIALIAGGYVCKNLFEYGKKKYDEYKKS